MAEYAIAKPLQNGLALARRISDGETFLRQEFNIETKPELEQLLALYQSGAYDAATEILNHENLVGLTGPVQALLFQGQGNIDVAQRYILWDWCDAGTLDVILREPPFPPGDNGFLPESLVWHVTLSVLKALMWLHEGYRENRDNPSENGIGRLYRTDDDWMPILHRDIEPHNIYFQSRRGIETYGRCKLGNFGNCYVSGSVGATDEAEKERVSSAGELPGGTRTGSGRVNQAVTTEEGDPPLEEVKPLWFKELEAIKDRRGSKSRCAYTTGTEMFALGAIMYHMMKGQCLPDPRGCSSCGCSHLNPPEEQECNHDCEPDIHLDGALSSLTMYTAGLREVAGRLLGSSQAHSDRAKQCYIFAFARFHHWRNNDPDGWLYKDEFDDRAFRAEKKKEKNGREQED